MPEKLTKDIVEGEPAPKSGAALLFDTEVKGFGVRVFAPTKRHPHGARSFFLNYRATRKERRYTIGLYPDWSVQEARQEAKDLRKRIDRGEDPTLEKRTREEAPTVQNLAERYRDEHLPKKAKRSQHDDWTHLEKHVLPFKAAPRSPKMGERKVTEIHDGDIRALHTAITKAGHPTLANRVLATTSKMFALSLQKKAGEDKPWRDAALGNPCRGVERNPEEGRERFFSEAEIAAISDALNEYSNQERNHPIARESALASANCIRFVMLTGCRPAEAMTAKWSQVDDEPGFWIKPSSHTKTRKVHKLALSPPALELLERMREGRQDDCLWIFPGQKPGEHIKQLRSCWGWVRDRATVLLRETSAADEPKAKLARGVAGDRIYDLRHSFASFGAAGGITLQVIGKLLGHTQARTTQRYAHLADDVMAEAAAKIGGTISNAGKGGDKVSALRGEGLMPRFKARLVNNQVSKVCDPVDRETWKWALQIIFTELRADTVSKQDDVRRQLDVVLSFYLHLADQPHTPVKKLNKWTAAVRKRAGELAGLLSSMPESVIQPLGYPKILGPKILPALVEELRTLAATAKILVDKSGRKGSSGIANSYLIDRLNQMYFAATGKQGGAGRVNNPTVITSQPGGPFFRLVKAALTLVADKQGDEAILKAIREHMAPIKSEELMYDVNRKNAEDLQEVFDGPHKSDKAFRDYETRAEKRITDAKVEEKKIEKRRRPDKVGPTTRSLN